MRRLGSSIDSSPRGPVWSDAELDALEAQRTSGLSTQEVVDLFAAKGAPVCVNLKTYPVKVEGGKVFVDVG